mmetsp:Transcript_33872/g.95929  ORF Transcript_33872/g.95929 Transcript_33872/m.95929 type:complete len:257 (+) Transcript_33872:1983-2753(+)
MERQRVRGDLHVVPGNNSELGARSLPPAAAAAARGCSRVAIGDIGKDGQVLAKGRYPRYHIVRLEESHNLNIPLRWSPNGAVDGSSDGPPGLITLFRRLPLDYAGDLDTVPPANVQQCIALPEEAAAVHVGRRPVALPLDVADALVHERVVDLDAFVVAPRNKLPRPPESLNRTLTLMQHYVARAEPSTGVEHQLPREPGARYLPVLAVGIVWVQRHSLYGPRILQSGGLFGVEAVDHDRAIVRAARNVFGLGVKA